MNGSPGSAAELRSFRDPAGFVVSTGDRIFRVVNRAGRADLEAFLASQAARKWTAAGRIVGTTMISGDGGGAVFSPSAAGSCFAGLSGGAVLEHERIEFPSYPYEWPPEMLHAAGRLSLELASDLLEEGLGLKDGTPYNLLFRGPEPVFVDVLSFERRDRRNATWLAYGQFVRTFLLPLLVNRHFKVPLGQILLSRRDGLEPEEVYQLLPRSHRLRFPFLSLVSIPVWLSARRREPDPSIYHPKLLADPERAAYILTTLFRRLQRTLNRLSPDAEARSVWSGYTGHNGYSAADVKAKQDFVAAALQEFRPRAVLDIGSNTGKFSVLAAAQGATVVAIDSDPVVVGRLWRRAKAECLPILPLSVNLTRPTPAVGWQNRECFSFLDRARGAFDAVFLLAVLHHILVTDRIPLEDVLSLAADLTRDLVLIEFIQPEDPMFRRIARGRDELHKDLTPLAFEAACAKYFAIVRSRPLESGSRSLYVLRKKR